MYLIKKNNYFDMTKMYYIILLLLQLDGNKNYFKKLKLIKNKESKLNKIIFINLFYPYIFIRFLI